MKAKYEASDIEVLKGLEPVRKRPGMYTDTSRPDHLAQEVIDNSVDEAISGFAKTLEVTLYRDGSLEVVDDGRGMPVDVHRDEKVPGVELILTRLHAGAKFSNKSYRFSGGLHGVGVSVVNALAKRLEVRIRRDGQEYTMAFADGRKVSNLKVTGKTGKRNTGTTIRFWPNAKYFDSARFTPVRLKHLLRSKAVLCPGLTVRLHDEAADEHLEWHYEEGLKGYLQDALGAAQVLPADAPFTGRMTGNDETVDWAVVWDLGDQELVTEGYVNLIPTAQGGTHVNGFRMGLTEAVREFCEFRNLTPRGVRISPEDVWDRCSYVLAVQLSEPQFSGQTKERLTSRECATFVNGVVKDAFSLWLKQHTETGERIAEFVIQRAQARQRSGRQVVRKKVTSGPALPGKLADCTLQATEQTELFLVEGDSAGGSAKQARDREFQAILPLRGKILNAWEVDQGQLFSSQEIHNIAVALGVDPGSSDLRKLRYGKVCILADADSDGAHISSLLCALFVRHFTALVEAGRVYVAMPPLYRIDVGKEVFYALDEGEKQGVLDRIAAEGLKGKVNVQRFKGLGEMNPNQLRETTIAPETRRLVQLTMGEEQATHDILDMLLAKKRAADRRAWLESKGDMAEV